jgi:hypothetical protein
MFDESNCEAPRRFCTWAHELLPPWIILPPPCGPLAGDALFGKEARMVRNAGDSVFR